MRLIVRVTRSPSSHLSPLRVEAHGPHRGDRGSLVIGLVAAKNRAFPTPGGVVLPLEWLADLQAMLAEVAADLREYPAVPEDVHTDGLVRSEGEDDVGSHEL